MHSPSAHTRGHWGGQANVKKLNADAIHGWHSFRLCRQKLDALKSVAGAGIEHVLLHAGAAGTVCIVG